MEQLSADDGVLERRGEKGGLAQRAAEASARTHCGWAATGIESGPPSRIRKNGGAEEKDKTSLLG